MKILVVTNHDGGLYKFRREVIEKLLEENEVYLSLPDGEYINYFKKIGCHYYACEFDRHGTNPIKEFRQIRYYKKILREIKPNIVFTYTIKPNVYCGSACAALKIPYVANITGLGTAVENGGVMQKVTLLLYKYGLRKAKKVFFQNVENKEFMIEHKIIKIPYELIPGSGVNLSLYEYKKYPIENRNVFLFVGRIMKDKGIDEFLYTARIIKEKYNNVDFEVVGILDDKCKNILQEYVEEGSVIYHGEQTDVRPFYEKCSAVVLPSYHEGMANVLLEGAAMGRPVIASRIHGCMEAFEEGISGIGCESKDTESLVQAIEKFLKLSYEEKVVMGINGRKKMEKEFNRQIIVDKYIKEVEQIGRK